ncbi:protein KASH5 isoform X3 [Hemicordylus capensis]|uniref:protein KASH5 isoform X3 n=1 Tax=Hemicordylus capensis TaxID=884348 RepID=UPI0023026075|nr:protein KASH5 isoform X3 [Hemicordylus capensis]
MEDFYHKTLENAAVAELTADLSTETVPWDSIGVSSQNIILSAGQWSEEHVLKYTFKACDPEQTGEVSVFRIIEYLQEMTGQNCEDWRFQSLYKRLDPEERGIAVDFSTFHAVMKEWITDCRQDGEEATDLVNSIEDLQHGNKQLAVQNIKLQRTIEAAEELNSRLSEEISELKGKLRGTQQALEQARVMANELEDLKLFSKCLEEENSKFHTQARQLEKEQQFLSVQVDNLQEENKKLLLEKEGSRCKIKELLSEKAKMKFQLCDYENLISCKDTTLNEKMKRVEELTVTLDEYQMVVQELKLEIKRLQDQLCQSYKDLEMLPRDSLETVTAYLQASAQPLCMEIEETQKEFSEEAGLPSPLCGMFPSLLTSPGEFRTLEKEWAACANSPDITAFISTKSNPETAPQEQALVPVHGELIPTGGKESHHNWFEILIQRFLAFPFGCLLLHILQKLLPGLLVICALLLALFYVSLPYNQHPIWIEPKGISWPHLQLRYLEPPPI